MTSSPRRNAPPHVVLLEQREHLAVDEDTGYWIDEAATVLEDCTTRTRMESLKRYLAAAREPEALAAYAAVRALESNDGQGSGV